MLGDRRQRAKRGWGHHAHKHYSNLAEMTKTPYLRYSLGFWHILANFCIQSQYAIEYFHRYDEINLDVIRMLYAERMT